MALDLSEQRYEKLNQFLNKHCSRTLRDHLTVRFQSPSIGCQTFHKFLEEREYKHRLYHHAGYKCCCGLDKNPKKFIDLPQWNKFYVMDETQADVHAGSGFKGNCACQFRPKPDANINEVDISFASKLISLLPKDTATQASVDEIRNVRNQIAHQAETKKLDKLEFDHLWSSLETAVLTITKAIAPGSADAKQRLIKHLKEGIDLESRIECTEKNLQIVPFYVPRPKEEDCSRECLQSAGSLVLTGITGSGKTSMALQLLKSMKTKYPENIPIIPLDIRDMLDILKSDSKYTVFVDDPFGKRNVNNGKLDDWECLIEKIQSQSSPDKDGNRKLFVIFGIHENILDHCKNVLRKYDMFQKQFIVDLSSEEHRMSHHAKVLMLKAFCEYQNGKIEDERKYISTNEFAKYDKQSNMKMQPDFHQFKTLHWSTILMLSRLDTYYGFPLCCSLFFREKESFTTGPMIFKDPEATLISNMQKLRGNDPTLFTVLIYAALQHGGFRKSEINIEVLESVAKAVEIAIPTIHDVYDKLDSSKSYFSNCQDAGGEDVYNINHETVRGSILVVFGKNYRCQNEILKFGHRDIKLEYIRTSGYKSGPGEVVVVLEESQDGPFIKEFGLEIISSETSSNESACTKICDHFFEIGILNDKASFLDAYKKACKCGRHHLASELLKRNTEIENVNLTEDEIISGIEMALHTSDFVDTVTSIIALFPKGCEVFYNISESGFGKADKTLVTPLAHAILHNRRYCALTLLKKSTNASLHIRTRDDKTLLHCCVIHDLHDVCSELLEKAPTLLNVSDEDDCTPIMLAMLKQSQNCVDVLLTNKADINGKFHNGNNLLHYAASNNMEEMCKKLLQLDPSMLNIQNDKGCTPLMLAANSKHSEVALCLIAFGADVTKTYQKGNVLHISVRRNLLKVCQKLVEIRPQFLEEIDDLIPTDGCRSRRSRWYNECATYIADQRKNHS